MKKSKNYFKYIIIIGVLFIPFIYSFFYLKAYWNPYGKGNMDNLPVAIVNKDNGNNGKDLVKELLNSKSLNFSVVNEKDAEDGLYNKKYYAVISIPSDFTESMNSINSSNKKHPTITYSPNQKSNYLASQIIDRVIISTEAKLDNKINSTIIDNLNNNLNNVPNKLDTISNGFSTMKNGVNTLNQGSLKLKNGSFKLYNSFIDYNKGINDIKNGSDLLNDNLKKFNDGVNSLDKSTDSLITLKESVNTLSQGLNLLATSSENYKDGLNNFVDGSLSIYQYAKASAQNIVNTYETNNLPQDENYITAKTIISSVEVLEQSSTQIKGGYNTINSNINTINYKVNILNDSTSKLEQLKQGITTIKESSEKILQGSKTLNNGINVLAGYTDDIKNGIKEISNGNKNLNNGITTLNNKVTESKNELDTNINKTKNDLKKTESLTEFSKNPVKVNKIEVNKVDSYGTAFSPLFISIALWIGCLMFYIVLYLDKDKRFKLLGIDNKNYLKRTLSYHAIASVSSLILGLLLILLLNLNITNIALYFITMLLIANAFLAVMEFLIVNLKDLGKFIALIILVLQLASSGGTFPIETVTKGFRFLHKLLPMTYTINLLKESLVTIENNLLTKNIIVVIIIFISFFSLNIILDIYKQKRVSD